MRESKQRKIMPWLQMTKDGKNKRDKESSQNKMKILDVKIVQQVFKRNDILESTTVFDGTGKVQLDQNSDEVLAILNADQ